MEKKTKDFVLNFARSVIRAYVEDGRILEVPKDCPKELKEKRGVFVTLYKNGMLRGCIGIPYPVASALENLRNAAVAATRDPRFPPLVKDELKDVKIEVSLLTEPKVIKVSKPKEYLEKIREGVDGVIIKKGLCEALYLPQVWEEIPDKVEFLESLCLKAGLAPDDWQRAILYKFQVDAAEE